MTQLEILQHAHVCIASADLATVVTGQSVECVALKAVCAGSQKIASAPRCFYASLRIKRLAVQKNLLRKIRSGAVDNSFHARPTLRSVGE
jgi:hypothetical protein